MRAARWIAGFLSVAAASVVSFQGGEIGWSEAAYADTKATEIKVGAELMAIHDVSLDEAVIIRGAKVSVTKTSVHGGSVFLDVALEDGHVVKSVPIGEIQKSFRVVV